SRMPTSTAMIPITTRSSTNVNAVMRLFMTSTSPTTRRFISPCLPRLRIGRGPALFHLIEAARLGMAIPEQLVLPPFLAAGAGPAVHHVPAADVGRGDGLLLGTIDHDCDLGGVVIGRLAQVIDARPAGLGAIEPGACGVAVGILIR